MQMHVITNKPIASGGKLVPEKSEFFPADFPIQFKSIFHIPLIVQALSTKVCFQLYRLLDIPNF